MALLTVAVETPANFATSARVGGLTVFFCFLDPFRGISPNMGDFEYKL